MRARLADAAAARSREAHAGALVIRDEALALLKERFGLQFEHYREATINRRIANRIIASRAEHAEEYLGMLREPDGEIQLLAANLTIKVSRFYRNARVFDQLQREVLPDLQERFGGPSGSGALGAPREKRRIRSPRFSMGRTSRSGPPISTRRRSSRRGAAVTLRRHSTRCRSR